MGCGASNAQQPPGDAPPERAAPAQPQPQTSNDVAAAHAAVYAGLGGGCPYAKFFATANDEGIVQETFIPHAAKEFEDRWTADGAKTGAAVNDHNYTAFGKGPTCGLMVASLDIGVSACDGRGTLLADIPEGARVGLLKENSTRPAVVRISTMGRNGAEALHRMAVKTPFEGEGPGEMNFTAVESLDRFIAAGYRHIATLSEDAPEGPWLNRVQEQIQGVYALRQPSFPALTTPKNATAKTYFGQVPYKLGEGHAMKYRFRSVSPALGEIDLDQHATRKHLRDVLTVMPIVFALEIQIRDDPASHMVQHDADREWNVQWVEVGSLTIPKQPLDGDGVCPPLRAALQDGVPDNVKAAMLHTLNFHPAAMPDIHYPLGEIQHVRCAYYAVHAKRRADLLLGGAGPCNVDFKKLAAREDIAAILSQPTASIINGNAEEMPEVFAHLDAYTKLVVKHTVPVVMEALLTPVDEMELDTIALLSADAKLPSAAVPVKIGSHKTVELVGVEHMHGSEAPRKGVMVLRELHPRTWEGTSGEDVVMQVSDEDAQLIEECTCVDQILPVAARGYEDRNADDTVSKFCFHGYGLPLMKLDEATGGYVLDLMSLRTLPTRAGFESYGVKAYFSGDQQLVKIEKASGGVEGTDVDVVTPEDETWNHAKFVVKSSLLMYVTGVHRLVGCPFLVAAAMERARRMLPRTHGVFRLLSIPLLRVALVNNYTAMLGLHERSPFFRGTGLEVEGLTALADRAVAECDLWMPMPAWLDAHEAIQKLNATGGSSEPGFRAHATALFTAHRTYVQKWLQHVYADDEALLADPELAQFWGVLVQETASLAHAVPKELTRDVLADALAQFMFVVTGYQELYCCVGEYLGVSASALRTAKGAERADLQSHLIAKILTALMSVRTAPLVGADWRGHFTKAERLLWDDYQAELERVSAVINEGNAECAVPFTAFDPACLSAAMAV